VREQLLEEIGSAALEALMLERAMIGAHARVVHAAAANHGQVPAADAGILSAVMSGHRLSEVIGSRTRAVHDLLRLTGDGGDQPADSGLTIVFATPPPAPAELGAAHHPVIIDLPALEAPR
jgi:hypothetical protein